MYRNFAEEIFKDSTKWAMKIFHRPLDFIKISKAIALHIAKYFFNSIREDNLVAINLYGIIYAPGSAGATHEILQHVTQNDYGNFGYHTPMIFMGMKRYVRETFICSPAGTSTS